ncbi:hypothetical protein HNP40_002685 [Mycobacteroides chelonae]|nr:hypothetical protein [Mycobacteroides chelonae]
MDYPPARPTGPAAYMVLSSRFSSKSLTDPHEYWLIIGMVLAIPFGLLAAGTPPLALPRGQRLHAFIMPTRIPPCATNPPAPFCKNAP